MSRRPWAGRWRAERSSPYWSWRALFPYLPQKAPPCPPGAPGPGILLRRKAPPYLREAPGPGLPLRRKAPPRLREASGPGLPLRRKAPPRLREAPGPGLPPQPAPRPQGPSPPEQAPPRRPPRPRRRQGIPHWGSPVRTVRNRYKSAPRLLPAPPQMRKPEEATSTWTAPAKPPASALKRLASSYCLLLKSFCGCSFPFSVRSLAQGGNPVVYSNR